LLQDSKVNKAVLKEMQAAGKSAGFAPFEILEGVALTDDEWTPQSVSCDFFFGTLRCTLTLYTGLGHFCAETQPQGH
jgi:hypothetical protein